MYNVNRAFQEPVKPQASLSLAFSVRSFGSNFLFVLGCRDIQRRPHLAVNPDSLAVVGNEGAEDRTSFTCALFIQVIVKQAILGKRSHVVAYEEITVKLNSTWM